MKTCGIEVSDKGFVLCWVDEKGFGQFPFWADMHGQWHYDSETLSDETVVEAFACFLKDCKRV